MEANRVRSDQSYEIRTPLQAFASASAGFCRYRRWTRVNPYMSDDDQSDKRRRIVEGGFTRGCDPEQYRTRCTGNEDDETNPCGGKGVGAQEDGAHPVPSDQKACSWIAKQAMTKKELDDACRVDSMDAEDADYARSSPEGLGNNAIKFAGPTRARGRK